MPCYQGTGLGCPVALLAGFASKGKTMVFINKNLYCMFTHNPVYVWCFGSLFNSHFTSYN